MLADGSGFSLGLGNAINLAIFVLLWSFGGDVCAGM